MILPIVDIVGIYSNKLMKYRANTRSDLTEASLLLNSYSLYFA